VSWPKRFNHFFIIACNMAASDCERIELSVMLEGHLTPVLRFSSPDFRLPELTFLQKTSWRDPVKSVMMTGVVGCCGE
jgi:hypothetical protein